MLVSYAILVSFKQVMQDKNAWISWPLEGGQNNAQGEGVGAGHIMGSDGHNRFL